MPNPENIKDHTFDKHPEYIGPGRKKGTKNRSTILKKWLAVAIKINGKHNPTGKEFQGTVADEIDLALIAKARSGDVQAIKEIKDTLFGKIPDKTETKHSGAIITGIEYIIPNENKD